MEQGEDVKYMLTYIHTHSPSLPPFVALSLSPCLPLSPSLSPNCLETVETEENSVRRILSCSQFSPSLGEVSFTDLNTNATGGVCRPYEGTWNKGRKRNTVYMYINLYMYFVHGLVQCTTYHVSDLAMCACTWTCVQYFNLEPVLCGDPQSVQDDPWAVPICVT